MLKIANPIYDSVFKYMMDDNKVAKLLLSKIIGQEVVELELKPTEFNSKIEHKTLTVFRLDFKAKIVTDTGKEKIVIIEIQKAKLSSDIMRFRRYLGAQYQNEDNTKEDEKGRKVAFPIISIYFLGHKLEHTTAPVIKIGRTYENLVSGKIIKDKETFIESLTHDSFVIQIPYLKAKRQNELTDILSVFDQTKIEDNSHIINIDESKLPKKYQKIIRRLQMAMSEKEIADQMIIEDDIVEELCNLERTIEKQQDALAEKDNALAEKDNALAEKDRKMAEILAELERLKKG